MNTEEKEVKEVTKALSKCEVDFVSAFLEEVPKKDKQKHCDALVEYLKELGVMAR